MKYKTPEHLVTDQVYITLVGVGGTGCVVAHGLARLHRSLISLGHPGLSLTLVDPGKVREANVGRQLYGNGDVGQYKADVTANRINLFYECEAEGLVSGARDLEWQHSCDLIIECVDSKKARREVRAYRDEGDESDYYIDCGNESSTGQVLIEGRGIPSFRDKYPNLLEGKEDNRPSCSLAEALEHQELYINQAVANHALQMVWSLLRHGGLDYSETFIDLKKGRVMSS